MRSLRKLALGDGEDHLSIEVSGDVKRIGGWKI